MNSEHFNEQFADTDVVSIPAWNSVVSALPFDGGWTPLSRCQAAGRYYFLRPWGDGVEIDWTNKRARLVPVRTIGWTPERRARSMG